MAPHGDESFGVAGVAGDHASPVTAPRLLPKTWAGTLPTAASSTRRTSSARRSGSPSWSESSIMLRTKASRVIGHDRVRPGQQRRYGGKPRNVHRVTDQHERRA